MLQQHFSFAFELAFSLPLEEKQTEDLPCHKKILNTNE
jgi:hypothetical protein